MIRRCEEEARAWGSDEIFLSTTVDNEKALLCGPLPPPQPSSLLPFPSPTLFSPLFSACPFTHLLPPSAPPRPALATRVVAGCTGGWGT
eukprot:2324449-Rhodomonas_salina.1